MKTLLTALILLSTHLTGYSQEIRLDATEAVFENGLIEAKIKYNKTTVNEDGSDCIVYTDKNKSEVMHYYDATGKCILAIIIPSSKEKAKQLQKQYNKKFTILTESTWLNGSTQIKMDAYQDRYLFAFN